VLRLMPNSDKSVAQFSKQLIDSVRSGDANPLEVLVMLRSLEAVSELVREEIKDNINTAAEKYPEKKFEAFGAIVEKADFGKYNYASACDPEWETLDAQFKTIETKRKEREAFLRALREPMTAVNRETGEVYEIRPPFKKSNEGVRVYLKHKS
jgi:hypothetical protein